MGFLFSVQRGIHDRQSASDGRARYRPHYSKGDADAFANGVAIHDGAMDEVKYRPRKIDGTKNDIKNAKRQILFVIKTRKKCGGLS